jgi:cation:H+ antiporter
MLVDFGIVLGGAAGILALAEAVIRQTLRVARHYGLSGSFVGLTILSIGTSLLEIITHVVGSLDIVREPEIMTTMSGLLIGSNVGSDIFQQNFVLALVGLLAAVVVVRRNLVIEVGGLLGASALLWLICLGGAISRLEGAVLVLAYLAYLAYLGRHGVHDAGTELRRRLSALQVVMALALIGACFVGMTLVAEPVLNAASRLVATLPLSASFFGVIVLGVCAALPELTTALIAVRRGEREISTGILIGSNITNPLLGVGLGALISTYTVPRVVLWYDLPVKLATGAILFATLFRHQRLRRGEAVLLILAYLAYVVGRQWLFPRDV